MKSTKRKAHRLPRKRRDRSDTKRPPIRRDAYALDQSRALSFVKLIYAGLPPRDAVGFILPDAPIAKRQDIASEWANSPLTLAATQLFTEGVAWEELSPDARLTLARDKFLAENAYVLYTNSLHTALTDEKAPIGAGALRSAYTTIVNHLDSRGKGDDDPTDAFLKGLVDGRIPLDQPIAQLVDGKVVATEKG